MFAEDDGSKKRKRASKPKDPNAPKRPASSYILFQNAIRSELRKQFPEITNAELLSMISEKWKSMPAEDKEVCMMVQLTRISARFGKFSMHAWLTFIVLGICPAPGGTQESVFGGEEGVRQPFPRGN